jgi:multidrug efflux pump subunit AcrB
VIEALIAVFAVVALLALGLCAWLLISIAKSLLTQANAYQIMERVNATQDARIREMLSKFDKKAEADPNVARQQQELIRRAESYGYTNTRSEPPLPPAPEPVNMMEFPEFVE